MQQLSFQGLSISYDHHVLEPRPWTEAQSSWAAELLGDAPAGPVLELCAGVDTLDWQLCATPIGTS